MVVGPVVLDERGHRGDVAGVHWGHAGSATNGRRLVVQVQHSVETLTRVALTSLFYSYNQPISFLFIRRMFCLLSPKDLPVLLR